MEIALTGTQIGLALLGVLVLIIGVIAYMRFFINRRGSSDLAENYADSNRETKLKTRTKYPEVDGLSYSGTFLNLGLAVALIIIILAFSYTEFDKKAEIPDNAMDVPDELQVEPPRTKKPPPPPPPPPPPKIEEVAEEEIEEEDQDLFKDQTIEEETAMEETPEPEPAPAPPPPPPKKEKKKIFRRAEQMPRFPGCEDIDGGNKEKEQCAQQKLLEYIYDNIEYPTIAKETQTEGTVYIQFVVTENGKIENIKVRRDPGAGLGEEAKRVVESMNNMSESWTPGRQRGKPVPVMFNLPVKFQLE